MKEGTTFITLYVHSAILIHTLFNIHGWAFTGIAFRSCSNVLSEHYTTACGQEMEEILAYNYIPGCQIILEDKWHRCQRS